jgi:asparagine synthase (glutamine-hydrolysing)
MCGILGSINIENTADYLATIRHRGPDAHGIVGFKVDDHDVKLLHQRLSIVDLSEAGCQPMYTDNQDGCIIFNGEIYNHETLRDDLPDVTFRGHSDTETIANYFNRFGVKESVQKLNGIFGLAYLDIKSSRLYLVRDRFGVKPLYYYFDQNRLLFSSEIRPLKACLEPELDQGNVLNLLTMRYGVAPFTLYENILKVEPGQMLVFDLSGPALTMEKNYFLPQAHKLGNRKGELAQLTKEYGDLFQKAVARQLMADVEVGVLLSGGVDSALVAAIAKEKSQLPLKAFTVGFDGGHDEVDEITFAAETASLLKLEHFQNTIDFSDFLGSFRRIVDIVEEPIGTTSIIPMYSLARLAASQVKVVLSGQGADEPLGGYKKYKALNLIQQARQIVPFLALTKILQPIYQKRENLRRVFASIQASDEMDSYLQFNSIVCGTEVSGFFNEQVRTSVTANSAGKREIFKNIWKERQPAASSLSDKFLYYDLRTSLADDLLMYTDKITMNFGLECRVPILDNDLIEFIESLDNRYKYNGKTGKIIHKAFAADYLPQQIINRKKLGFQSPTEYWFRKHSDEIIAIFSSGKQFAKVFDIGAVFKLLSEHAKGRNMEKQIFLLLSLYYLIEDEDEKSR